MTKKPRAALPSKDAAPNQTDIEPEYSTSRHSQRGRILQLLIDAHYDWVPLPELMARAAQYNSRILELRRLGFRIENRTELRDGKKHSWFRLRPGTDTLIPPAVPTLAIEPPPEPGDLFGDLMPLPQWHDPEEGI